MLYRPTHKLIRRLEHNSEPRRLFIIRTISTTYVKIEEGYGFNSDQTPIHQRSNNNNRPKQGADYQTYGLGLVQPLLESQVQIISYP